MRWVGFAIGLVVVVATATSLVLTLVVPRAIRSRFVVVVDRGVSAVFLAVVRGLRRYESKDRLLAVQGVMTLMLMLAAWLALFLAGYALLIWPLIAPDGFGAALRQSGSSLFTLGLASDARAAPTTVHFLAAFTGLVVVALLIAYLPTLYSAFSRRETLVTTLESRAGVPAWGPEILARHQSVGIMDNLPAFYADWERWSAELAETHTTYPMLIGFRSPDPLRSWVVSLLAVLDSAALYLALCPSRAPSEARLCLRMGFTALRQIAALKAIPFEDDPYPDDAIQLTREEFDAGILRLGAAEFPMERTADEAWPHFRGWRVNYEGIVYALADRVVAVPAPWSGPRRHAGDDIMIRRPVDRRPDGM